MNRLRPPALSPSRRAPRTPGTLGVFLLILGLAGCVPPKNDRTEILFSMWGSLKQLEVERRMIEEFERAHPDIRVRMLPIGHRYPDKIQAMMVGGAAPDVVMVEMNQYDEWASRGVLLDLTESVLRVADGDELLPVPSRAFERDGRYFGVPVNAHGLATYVNLDAIRAAGFEFERDFTRLTWEKLLEFAPRLSKRKGDPRAPTDFAFLMPHPSIIFFGYGGKLFDDPERPDQVAVPSPEAKAAFEMIRRAYRSGYAVPPDVVSDQGTYQLFREGRVALLFDGRWRTPELKDTKFTWDVVPIPAGPAGAITTHGGTIAGIWSGSPNADAARKFIEFYGSREGARAAASAGRNVPVFRRLAFGEFLQHRPPHSIRQFPETMEAGRSQILLYGPGLAEVNSIFGRAVDTALHTDRPIDSILAILQSDLHDWLKWRKMERGEPRR
jgi:multiple sugar transport system substrate-binding protein